MFEIKSPIIDQIVGWHGNLPHQMAFDMRRGLWQQDIPTLKRKLAEFQDYEKVADVADPQPA